MKSKVRSFRCPNVIYDYFISRGMKLGKVFKEAVNTPLTIRIDKLVEYEAGKETAVRLNDEEITEIKEEAKKLAIGHTNYMRLLIINYYLTQTLEEY